jgi:hypothetical protein
MECKQCREPFNKNGPYEVWEVHRQYIEPDPRGETPSKVHLQDAGVFCSRKCLTDYLGAGNRSGVFKVKKPQFAP